MLKKQRGVDSNFIAGKYLVSLFAYFSANFFKT